jgi:hypothetical protein
MRLQATPTIRMVQRVEYIHGLHRRAIVRLPVHTSVASPGIAPLAVSLEAPVAALLL